MFVEPVRGGGRLEVGHLNLQRFFVTGRTGKEPRLGQFGHLRGYLWGEEERLLEEQFLVSAYLRAIPTKRLWCERR